MKTESFDSSIARRDRFEVNSPEEDNGGMLEYWQMLQRRRGIVLLGALLGALAGLLFSLTQTTLYQARSVVEVQGANDDLLNTRYINPLASAGDSSGDIQTQIKMFQSESLLGGVVEKLNAKVNGAPESADMGSRRRAVSIAAGTLKVQALGPSRLLEIRSDSTDPAVAAEFINTLTGEFTEKTLVGLWKSAQHTGELLSKQLEELRGNLEKSEGALQKYAVATDLIFTDEKDNVAEEKLRQLQEELSKSQGERVTRQSRFETANLRPAETLPEVLDDPAIQSYQLRLADLRRQLAELNTALTPAHYKIQRIQAQIAEVQEGIKRESANIVKRLRNEYDAAVRRERLLAGAYFAQTKIVSGQSAKGIRYNILRREVDAKRQLYHSILQKVKEYGIASALRASNIRVVDPAVPPFAPYKPNLLSNAMVGMLGGGCMGLVFLFFKERTDRSIKSPGESAFYLNVRELGVIPSSNLDDEKPRLRQPEWLTWMSDKLGTGKYLAQLTGNSGEKRNGNEPVELATWQRQPTLLAESFRTVLTSILFAEQNGKQPRVLVFTSSSPLEGKTTVVSNLAIALAEINRRVLVIDCDLRRPRQHKVFNLANTWGLTDLLREFKPIPDYPREALSKQTRIPNLWVLPSGPGAISISSLLHSARMPDLLDRFRAEFDMVLIDTPPMLQLSDARILGRLADGVILVLRAGQTLLDNSLLSARRFEEDGTPVLGAILNDWDPSKHGGYGYDSRYYDYIHGKAVPQS